MIAPVSLDNSESILTGLNGVVHGELENAINLTFLKNDKPVLLKGVRFIPSTRVELEHGAYQVMGYAIVEDAAVDGKPRRRQSYDTVLTVGCDKDANQ